MKCAGSLFRQSLQWSTPPPCGCTRLLPPATPGIPIRLQFPAGNLQCLVWDVHPVQRGSIQAQEGIRTVKENTGRQLVSCTGAESTDLRAEARSPGWQRRLASSSHHNEGEVPHVLCWQYPRPTGIWLFPLDWSIGTQRPQPGEGRWMSLLAQTPIGQPNPIVPPRGWLRRMAGASSGLYQEAGETGWGWCVGIILVSPA